MYIRSAVRNKLRLLGRPIWRRIIILIEPRVAARITRNLQGEMLLFQHPAAFLDAVATVAALGKRVRELEFQVNALQSRFDLGFSETILCGDEKQSPKNGSQVHCNASARMRNFDLIYTQPESES